MQQSAIVLSFLDIYEPRCPTRVRTIPVLGIGQYLPVLGGIGIGTIHFLSNRAQYWADNGLRRRLATHDNLISRSVPCEIRYQQLICHGHVSPLLATLIQLKLLDAAMMCVCVCVHHASWLHQTASVVQDSG